MVTAHSRGRRNKPPSLSLHSKGDLDILRFHHHPIILIDPCIHLKSLTYYSRVEIFLFTVELAESPWRFLFHIIWKVVWTENKVYILK